jgi:predicted peptidase
MRIILFNLCFLLLLCSCVGPLVIPPTLTPAPTTTSTATTTPSPTSTPTPTVTPLPSPGLHEFTTQVANDTAGATGAPVTIRYLLFLPKEYGQDPARKWPLILFLHGSGEAGDDLTLLKKAGLPALLAQQPDFPFVVIAPQIPAQISTSSDYQYSDPNAYLLNWGWSRWIDPLNNLLEVIETTYAVDPQRLYLTGLSLGDFGAWEYALRYPHRFAAVAPIAGGYRIGLKEEPDNICALKDTPIWVFHGDADTNVPYQNSEILVKGLQACGGTRIKFTLYAGASHYESFTRAYNDPNLYQWMLEHRLQ